MAFPVRGAAAYSHDFSPPRHLGVDIFADAGAPIVAPDAGAVTFGTDPLGGNVVNLKTSDGTRYYLAHLQRWEGNSGRIVQAGEVIGYVGDTGNARGKHPHLHLEVHSAVDGQAVDPYPLLESVAGPEHKHPALPGPSPATPPAQPSPAPAPAPPVAQVVPSSSSAQPMVLFGVKVQPWMVVVALYYFHKRQGRRRR